MWNKITNHKNVINKPSVSSAKFGVFLYFHLKWLEQILTPVQRINMNIEHLIWKISLPCAAWTNKHASQCTIFVDIVMIAVICNKYTSHLYNKNYRHSFTADRICSESKISVILPIDQTLSKSLYLLFIFSLLCNLIFSIFFSLWISFLWLFKLCINLTTIFQNIWFMKLDKANKWARCFFFHCPWINGYGK